MKDDTHTIVDKKQSLQAMLVTKNLLMDAIYESDGEIDDQQSESLMELETNIPVKVDGWAWTLMKNGAIDKEIELWQNRKEVVENIIKSLRNGKDRLKARAHQIMHMNELERLDGNQFWIKRTFSENRSVFIENVEEMYLKYQLPVMNHSEFAILEKITRLNEGLLKELLEPNEIHTLYEIAEKLAVETHTKCNVTDLPIDHKAIFTEVRPTVRIFAKK